MKIKVFTPNERGKIDFTREELEKLLNEVYNDGFRDSEIAQREKSTWTWTPPYRYSDSITIANGTNCTNTIDNHTQPIDKLTCTYDCATTNKNDTSIAKGVSISGVSPFTITMKIPEDDVKKATEQLTNLVTNQNGLAAKDVVDVFSNLAKELNF